MISYRPVLAVYMPSHLKIIQQPHIGQVHDLQRGLLAELCHCGFERERQVHASQDSDEALRRAIRIGQAGRSGCERFETGQLEGFCGGCSAGNCTLQWYVSLHKMVSQASDKAVNFHKYPSCMLPWIMLRSEHMHNSVRRIASINSSLEVDQCSSPPR